MSVRKVLFQILIYLKEATLFDLFSRINRLCFCMKIVLCAAVCLFDVMILKRSFLNGVQAEHYKTKR